jgi:FAD/FMN-containing dehydrogenase
VCLGRCRSRDARFRYGHFVTASDDENPDLFWAVCGGGGNFRVVTSLIFKLRPVKTVQFGPTFWPLEEAGTVLKAFQNFIKSAPEDVSGFCAFLIVPPAPMFPYHLHLKKVCGIVWCCKGSAERAEQMIKLMRTVGNPLLDAVGPAPFPAVQSSSTRCSSRACNGIGGRTTLES